MLEEAIAFASDAVAVPLHSAVADKGVVAGLRGFIGWWRALLLASDFEAGCAVMAVAVEPLTSTEGAAPITGPARKIEGFGTRRLWSLGNHPD